MATQHSGSLAKYPARVSFACYLAAIVAGAGLLHLPACRHAAAEPVRWIDAIFTSTSAACVTGLTTRSTSDDYNFLGQVVILGLIQLGGVGIMTVTTFAMVQLGSRASLRSRSVIVETLGTSYGADLRGILRRVLYASLLCEGAGAVLLAARFAFDMPLVDALWWGAFHSVSAFCNAGFGLHGDSLVPYQGDLIVNVVVPALVIIGGIGFPVILDVRRHIRRPWPELWRRLTLHSKIMILGTALLTSFTFVMFLVLEWDGVLAAMPWWKRILVALFQGIVPRTAGFNTVDYNDLTNATLFLTIILMAIGGGACSTAGGFKVSTLAVLVLYAWSRFRGDEHINVFRRTISPETAGRALVVVLVFLVTINVGMIALLVAEQADAPHRLAEDTFLDAMFEVVSALSTAGLSTGVTPGLSEAGKTIIMLLMFIGRLGPISIFLVISLAEKRASLEYAREEPLLG